MLKKIKNIICCRGCRPVSLTKRPVSILQMNASLTNNKKQAFTLIEIIVAVTIMSIMMVSVLTIFINATNITSKSEVSRVIQENVKNVIETISEDVRKNGIKGIADFNEDCDFNLTDNFKQGTKLCTYNNNYFLAKEIMGSYVRIDDTNKCKSVNDNCFLIGKNGQRLTNSSVAITDMNFYLSNEKTPMITMTLSIQPAMGKGISSTLIEQSNIVVQTTISDRTILKK